MSRRRPIRPAPILTGRVLEMMAAVGYRAEHPVARRAIEWLKRNQESRWLVVGAVGRQLTFTARSRRSSGLRAIGVDMSQPWIQRAVTWLKSVQNADGGWGESCLADRDPALKGAAQHCLADRVGDDRPAGRRGRISATTSCAA